MVQCRKNLCSFIVTSRVYIASLEDKHYYPVDKLPSQYLWKKWWTITRARGLHSQKLHWITIIVIIWTPNTRDYHKCDANCSCSYLWISVESFSRFFWMRPAKLLRFIYFPIYCVRVDYDYMQIDIVFTQNKLNWVLSSPAESYDCWP